MTLVMRDGRRQAIYFLTAREYLSGHLALYYGLYFMKEEVHTLHAPSTAAPCRAQQRAFRRSMKARVRAYIFLSGR